MFACAAASPANRPDAEVTGFTAWLNYAGLPWAVGELLDGTYRATEADRLASSSS